MTTEKAATQAFTANLQESAALVDAIAKHISEQLATASNETNWTDASGAIHLRAKLEEIAKFWSLTK